MEAILPKSGADVVHATFIRFMAFSLFAGSSQFHLSLNAGSRRPHSAGTSL
jgi:hypothetical protein